VNESTKTIGNQYRESKILLVSVSESGKILVSVHHYRFRCFISK